MAKIVHKGMWIDIKSLNAKDKKNFLTSLAFGFIASILWGIHLSHIGFLGNEPITDSWISETGLLLIRILMILFFLIGSEIDDNGYLNEPFGLLPIGALFFFLSVMIFAWNKLKS